ncbi:MAG: YkvA family protein [Bacillota bacterium]
MKGLQKLRMIAKNIGLAYSYIKDSNVSIINKALVIAPLLYIISPIDLISDYLIGIGWLDDTLIAVLTWGYMLKKLKKYETTKKDNSSADNKQKSDYDFADDEYEIK